MGTHDAHNLKSGAEILARQSRPQRNSTWTPKTRDWRYATGIIQHDDFEDAPKSRSVWCALDYDHQTRVRQSSRSVSRDDSRAGSELGAVETTEVAQTPKTQVSMTPTYSPRAAVQSNAAYKLMVLPKGTWRQVKRLVRSAHPVESDGEEAYDVRALVVRFKFTGKRKIDFKEIIGRPVSTSASLVAVRQNVTPPITFPGTPATARTAETTRAPHVLDSIESLHTFPLFKRPWVDETYDFNMAAIRSKMRSADTMHEELSDNYLWYADAVPVDAIFPPGVPISAKEISAFYPHHVRWKGVMVRLTNNDYRGPDIMGMQAHFRGAPTHHTTPAYMNNYQRDTVKTCIPAFRTTTFKGKSDRNLRTDHIVAGTYIQSMSKGCTLPSFEDLVRGLRRLPSGLDARGLTQCLSWYLNIRDTFTSKLDLNVLHTQSLIRALREPLKPFGPQNLDRNALEEWRSNGTFESVEIEDKKHVRKPIGTITTRQVKSQLHLNLDKEDVSMKVMLPIRHVLTFPFLALHGVVAEALELGIKKSEVRQAARKTESSTHALSTEAVRTALENEGMQIKDKAHETALAPHNTVMPTTARERNEINRIPKRPLPVNADMLSSHKKIRVPAGPRIPPAPRHFAPAPSRPLAPAAPRDQTYLSRHWGSPAPSSYYGPPPSQGNVYDQRDLQAREQGQDHGWVYRPDAAQGRGASYPPGYGNGQYGRRW